jgi:hypothetical protein
MSSMYYIFILKRVGRVESEGIDIKGLVLGVSLLASTWLGERYLRSTLRTFIRGIGDSRGTQTAEQRHTEVGGFIRTVDEDADADNFALAFINSVYDVGNGAASRHHVIDNEDAVAGIDDGSPAESLLVTFIFGIDGALTELSGNLEGKDNTAGDRTCHEVDRSRAEVLRNHLAELRYIFRVLKNTEFFPVDWGMHARVEQEVPFHNCA